jgi:hypothetical protein
VWFLALATLLVGLLHWVPYASGRYDTQLFSVAVGALSGFFIAWCCVAAGLWIQARRKAR